jgi:hypothetical protein
MKKAILYLFFAMAIMSLAMFTSCTDDSPSGVVKTYFSAMKSGNAEKAVKCTNVPEDMIKSRIKSYEKKIKRDDANMQLIKEEKVEILREEIDGDRAFVEIFIGVDGGMGIQMEVGLVNVDGQWKIKDE